MNSKDIAIFAVIMFVATAVAGWIQSMISSIFDQWGAVGSLILYLILLLPAYYLLSKFWRRRSD